LSAELLEFVQRRAAMDNLTDDATKVYLFTNSEEMLNAVTRDRRGANLPHRARFCSTCREHGFHSPQSSADRPQCRERQVAPIETFDLFDAGASILGAW
jgi:hypothetical protein